MVHKMAQGIAQLPNAMDKAWATLTQSKTINGAYKRGSVIYGYQYSKTFNEDDNWHTNNNLVVCGTVIN